MTCGKHAETQRTMGVLLPKLSKLGQSNHCDTTGGSNHYRGRMQMPRLRTWRGTAGIVGACLISALLATPVNAGAPATDVDARGVRVTPASAYNPVVPAPRIVNAMMRNATAAKYRTDIAAYSLRHYGVSTWAIAPRSVVLHYTVTDAGSWRGIINAWDVPSASGTNTGGEQPQPAAHFIIEQDGTIYQTMPLDLMVRHAYGHNHSAIGIEFVERWSASNVLARQAQMQAGVALVRWLQFEYGIPMVNVLGHGTANTHPLFFDRIGNRNDHTDWNAAEVARFHAALGEVPVKGGGPAAGSITKVRAGGPNTTVMGNLTAVMPQAGGFTQVFNCAQGRPGLALASIYQQRQTTPVMAMAQTDANGDICIYNSAQTHLLWDQYYAGSVLAAHQPARLLNTLEPAPGRPAGPVPAGQVIAVQTGKPNQAVMGTLTAWNPSGSGYLTVYPCTDPLPGTSNVNYSPGSLITNFVTARSDAAGRICIFTLTTSHIVWDQVSESAALTAYAGVRKYDARLPLGAGGNGGGYIQPGQVVRIRAAAGQSTVFGNLTVTNAQRPGYTVLYPCNAPKPPTSVNNYIPFRNSANSAMSRTDAEGWICIEASAPAHVIWDQFAESVSVPIPAGPVRLLDTR